MIALRPLRAGPDAQDPKDFGYGVPFEVVCTVGDGARYGGKPDQ